jgi:hypothetical protein
MQVKHIDGQTGRPARARPEPDLAWSYQARHYAGPIAFRVGPCRTIGPIWQPKPDPKVPLAVPGRPEARKGPAAHLAHQTQRGERRSSRSPGRASGGDLACAITATASGNSPGRASCSRRRLSRPQAPCRGGDRLRFAGHSPEAPPAEQISPTPTRRLAAAPLAAAVGGV